MADRMQIKINIFMQVSQYKVHYYGRGRVLTRQTSTCHPECNIKIDALTDDNRTSMDDNTVY